MCTITMPTELTIVMKNIHIKHSVLSRGYLLFIYFEYEAQSHRIFIFIVFHVTQIPNINKMLFYCKTKFSSFDDQLLFWPLGCPYIFNVFTV